MNKFEKGLLFLLLSIGYLAVGLSRLIVGVHSLNQVIYGYLIGLWTLTYVIMFWRPVVKKHMDHIQRKAYSVPEIKLLLLQSGLFSLGLLMV